MIYMSHLTVPKIRKFLSAKLGPQSLKYLNIHLRHNVDRTLLIRTKPKILQHPLRLWIFSTWSEGADGKIEPSGQLYMNGSSFGKTHTVSTVKTFRIKLLRDVKLMNKEIQKAYQNSQEQCHRDAQMTKDIKNPQNYLYRIENGQTVGVCYKLFNIATDKGMHKLLSGNKIHLHTIGHFLGKTYNKLIKAVKATKDTTRPDINVLYHVHYNRKIKAWDGIAGTYYFGKIPKFSLYVLHMWKQDHLIKFVTAN